MSRAPIEFVLQDADGNDVEYSIVLHPGSEALPLVWSIVQAGAQPLGRLLEGNLGRLLEAMTSEQDVELTDLIDELDLRLGDAIGDVFSIINATGSDKLVREILSHTYRNGVSLKQTRAFDDAYTANYAEMMEAVVKAVQVNRFLGLFRTSVGRLFKVATPADAAEAKIKSLEQLERLASTGSSGESGSLVTNG